MNISTAVKEAESLDAVGRHTDAINTLARATKTGDVEALTRLAKRLISGENAPSLPTDGLSFLQEAIDKGSAEAPARLAVLYAMGVLVNQSWESALYFLSLAAERAYEPAREQLKLLADSNQEHDVDWKSLAESIDLNRWVAVPELNNLSESPRVCTIQGFLSVPICQWLIRQSQPFLERALVYDPKAKKDIANNTRTNTVANLTLMRVEFLNIIIQGRMSVACGIPFSHFEAATILHYDIGEEIKNHYDFIDPKSPNYAEHIKQNGDRIVTFLTYLNEDYEGGETIFPELDVQYKGSIGDSLFFINNLNDGAPDLRTKHAANPPVTGEKWLMTQFIRNREVSRS